MAADATKQQDQPHEAPDQSQIVVVDFGKRQARKQIKRLRKGEGKLARRVKSIVSELVEAGSVSPTAQTVVIVVREQISAPWPFN